MFTPPCSHYKYHLRGTLFQLATLKWVRLKVPVTIAEVSTKRQRPAALQNLAASRGDLNNAAASWSAAALCRFSADRHFQSHPWRSADILELNYKNSLPQAGIRHLVSS